MTFDDLLKRDSAVAVTRDMAEGETVTYRPAGGGAYAIEAHVFREEPVDTGEFDRFRRRRAIVWVRNDSDPTVGVASPDENGDKIDVVLREGESATACRVSHVLRGDAGLWELEATA